MNTMMVDPNALVPYKNNVKKHSKEQIKNVAASIKSFGFVQPVVIDKNNVIVIGHSRVLASKELGLKEIPAVVVDTLSEEEVRALRVADNKLNESAWDIDMLELELSEIAWEPFEMDFDFTGDTKRRKAWEHLEKKCDLKKRIKQNVIGGFFCTTLFGITKDGMTLEEIKSDRSNVPLFADCAEWYLKNAIGHVGESWCIITAPKRRHKDFHFATEVCKQIAVDLGIAFYEDAAEAINRHRVEPVFKKNVSPVEDNIILYDDIVTTGETMRAVRDLFVDDHVVFPLVAIRNKGNGN